MSTRVQIQVRGVVQGVGFRPFVFSLARRRALRGQVRNHAAGVLIDLEGEPGATEQFIADIKSTPPQLSLIESLERLNNLAPVHYDDFRILASTVGEERFVPIPPDIATCPDCLRELLDPTDRRYRYPFINCTNCGPRFTIIEDTPYDRANTTMRHFKMCEACRGEYENPLDRRFHAEPTACPRCGPQLRLTDSEIMSSEDPVAHTRRQGVGDFKRLFNFQPEAVAYDLHPEYLSTKYALALDDVQTKVGVQHHHAHVASCMADNEIDGEVIGVTMDGLGFGTDGRLWGGEFFVADFARAERVAHLEYVPMPGGAKAIREPWRMAAVYLHRALGDEFLTLNIPFVQRLDRRTWAILRDMAASGTNCPETSSMGRLFDAMSSLLGLGEAANYEGQAAMALEAIADPTCGQSYEFQPDPEWRIIKATPVVQSAVEDLLSGIPPPVISAKFHQAVVDLIVAVARYIRTERRLNRVVLSGGVFQNSLLLERVQRKLGLESFDVFTHSRVPPNDGGIALGQAVVAHARIESGNI